MNGKLSLLVLVGACLFSSCAGMKNMPDELEKKEEEKPDEMVARVASVNEGAQYVLIQRFSRLVIPEDSVLYTLGQDENVASIRVTGERLGQFLAADIISGKLIVGDAVYLRTFEKKED